MQGKVAYLQVVLYGSYAILPYLTLQYAKNIFCFKKRQKLN